MAQLSTVAQKLLPIDIDVKEILQTQEYKYCTDDFITCHEIAYNCACGKINKVSKKLAAATPVECERWLNSCQIEFWLGTILHIALYWNSGEKGIKFYQLLKQYGAIPCRDYYEMLPWEQSGDNYIAPVGRYNCGVRDNTEFTEMYNTIKILELQLGKRQCAMRRLKG